MIISSSDSYINNLLFLSFPREKTINSPLIWAPRLTIARVINGVDVNVAVTITSAFRTQCSTVSKHNTVICGFLNADFEASSSLANASALLFVRFQTKIESNAYVMHIPIACERPWWYPYMKKFKSTLKIYYLKWRKWSNLLLKFLQRTWTPHPTTPNIFGMCSVPTTERRLKYRCFVATMDAAAVRQAVISVAWMIAFSSPVFSLSMKMLAMIGGFGGLASVFFGNTVTNFPPSELKTFVGWSGTLSGSL